MRSISDELRNYLERPHFRLITVSSDVKREALRGVCLGMVIDICGHPILLTDAEPIDERSVRISGWYVEDILYPRKWGNPEKCFGKLMLQFPPPRT